MKAPQGRGRVWRLIHWLIIVGFAQQIVYDLYQLFFVLRPDSGYVGPLFGAALEMPYERLMLRRMYSLEAWLAMTGLAIYVAITEIRPRLPRG